MINSPLIRPAISWGWHWGGLPLVSHDKGSASMIFPKEDPPLPASFAGVSTVEPKMLMRAAAGQGLVEGSLAGGCLGCHTSRLLYCKTNIHVY